MSTINTNYTSTTLNQNTTSPLSQEEHTFQNSMQDVALKNFYELHQKSQITGVSTSDYNQAIEDLGIDSSVPFAGNKAIDLLKEHGYDMRKPTAESILEYGTLESDAELENISGNKIYMSGGDAYKEATLGTYVSTDATTTLSTTEILESKDIIPTLMKQEEALENFYNLHQRSQITGVSSTEYNQAVEDLGIDSSLSQSGNLAVDMLKENGYSTLKPTLEAILKYGFVDEKININELSGNKTYMRGGKEYNDALTQG